MNNIYFTLSWLAFYLMTPKLKFLFCLQHCVTYHFQEPDLVPGEAERHATTTLSQVEHRDSGPGFDKNAQTLSNQCSIKVHTSRVSNVQLNHRIHLLLIFDVCQFPCCHSEFTYFLPLPIHVFSTRNINDHVYKFQVIFLTGWSPNGLTAYPVRKSNSNKCYMYYYHQLSFNTHYFLFNKTGCKT